jgi:methionyl-tRNA formyltransferase
MSSGPRYSRPIPKAGWWNASRTISVVVDNESWILPFAAALVETANVAGDRAELRRLYDEIPIENDIAFFLGCTGIARPPFLARNRRNLVVHSSDLPKGRGFAPLAWQIIAGQNEIVTCLIDAVDMVDAGGIVLRDKLQFTGNELYPEMRAAQGSLIIELCLRFLAAPEEPLGQSQTGKSTTFRRRTPLDSEIDPDKTIAAQFDLLRTVDNDNFPAFFSFRGRSYKLAITPLDTSLRKSPVEPKL